MSMPPCENRIGPMLHKKWQKGNGHPQVLKLTVRNTFRPSSPIEEQKQLGNKPPKKALVRFAYIEGKHNKKNFSIFYSC